MINPFVVISNKIACSLDNSRDKKVCGKKLGVFVPTPFARTHGATGSQSAPYLGLDIVLSDLKFDQGESFIDIGCGKGRVLAYLVSKGFKGKITGVELNPQVASVARSWTSNYRNIEIIEGDAFGVDFNNYTVLFMYRPMDMDTFIMFVNLLEMTLKKEIKLYYYADGESGFYLNERPGWDMLIREDIYKAGGYYIHKIPQRYSVWIYRPAVTE